MKSKLPIARPFLPMEAKSVDEIPTGSNWQYEPKWDGFRTLIFRDGGELLLQSRDQKSLNRYFPELVAPLLAGLPQKCVLDGEIVVALADQLHAEKIKSRRAQGEVEAVERDRHPPVVPCDLPDGIQLVYTDDRCRRRAFAQVPDRSLNTRKSRDK